MELKLLLLGLAIILYLYLLSYNKKHKRNIRTANRIRKKINTFNNEAAKLLYLRKIGPFVFEELILTAFKSKGYSIKRNKRYTGDGGIDGRVIKDGKLYLVQAKRYSSFINPTHLKDFQDVIRKEKADGGFFVHTGKTGKKSKDFKTNQIQIISGTRLLQLLSDEQ